MKVEKYNKSFDDLCEEINDDRNVVFCFEQFNEIYRDKSIETVAVEFAQSMKNHKAFTKDPTIFVVNNKFITFVFDKTDTFVGIASVLRATSRASKIISQVFQSKLDTFTTQLYIKSKQQQNN